MASYTTAEYLERFIYNYRGCQWVSAYKHVPMLCADNLTFIDGPLKNYKLPNIQYAPLIRNLKCKIQMSSKEWKSFEVVYPAMHAVSHNL